MFAIVQNPPFIPKCFQILRCERGSLSKKSAYLIVIYALLASGFAEAAEVIKGTYFAILTEPNYAVAAIDSRLTVFHDSAAAPYNVGRPY